jgi:hypothetical protein
LGRRGRRRAPREDLLRRARRRAEEVARLYVPCLSRRTSQNTRIGARVRSATESGRRRAIGGRKGRADGPAPAASVLRMPLRTKAVACCRSSAANASHSFSHEPEARAGGHSRLSSIGILETKQCGVRRHDSTTLIYTCLAPAFPLPGHVWQATPPMLQRFRWPPSLQAGTPPASCWQLQSPFTPVSLPAWVISYCMKSLHYNLLPRHKTDLRSIRGGCSARCPSERYGAFDTGRENAAGLGAC